MGANETVILLQESNEDASPASCSGDACSKISMQTAYWPGTTLIRTVSVRNDGPRTAQVSFDWGNVLGGCGVSGHATVLAGQTADLHVARDAMVVGYCKMRAKYV
jgi:hypothetical protein